MRLRQIDWSRDIPESPPSIAPVRWTVSNGLWAGIGVSAGLFYLHSMISHALIGLSVEPAPDTLPPASHAWIMEGAALYVWRIALAAVALTCMVAVSGPGIIGAGRSWRTHQATGGYFLSRAVICMAATMLVVRIAIAIFPVLEQFAGSNRNSTDPATHPLWYMILRSVAAGFAEEIIATLLVWWVLSLCRAKQHWIIAAIVAVHLSYHLYAGILVVGLIFAAYFAGLTYMRTGNIAAIALAHALYDIALYTRVYMPFGIPLLVGVLLLTFGVYVERQPKKVST